MGAKNQKEIISKIKSDWKTVPLRILDVRVFEEGEGEEKEKNRFLEFSFSSEAPYLRWYGYEIISHKDEDFNLERLKSSAPLLFNHNRDQQLGVIVDAWVKENRGHVKVKLSRSQFAEDKIKDIDDEILVNASFGYIINEGLLTKESDEEPNEYTMKTTPYEVSLVTVPADFTVGVGRSVTGDGPEIQIRGAENEPAAENKNPQIEINEPAVRSANNHGGANMEGIEQERNRIKSIQALGSKFNLKELSDSLVTNGTSIEDAHRAFLEKLDFKQKPVSDTDGEIDLTEGDKKKYSFLRAIYAISNPQDKKAQEAAGFEWECSIAAAKKSGQEAKGIIVPLDVLRQKRDLTVGSPTGGGNLVATELLSGSFIDILSKKAALLRSGAQMLTGLKGNIGIPRATGSATAYWVAEGAAPTDSALAFGLLNMSPKMLAAFVDITRQLMIQSSVDAENLVRLDLIRTMALKLDHAGLYGTGVANNQPLGLVSATGLNIVDITGGALNATEDDVIDMESLVASDDAEVDFMKYLMNSATKGALKKKPIVAGHPEKVYSKDNTVNGRAVDVSNQVAAGDLFYGNFNDLLFGFWGGLDLTVDPFTQATNAVVRVIAHQMADVGVRHGESFSRGYDATP